MVTKSCMKSAAKYYGGITPWVIALNIEVSSSTQTFISVKVAGVIG